MLKIGIDPAFRKNGYGMCIVDYCDKTIAFKIFKNGYRDFLSWLIHERPEFARYCVENSNLQKAIWINEYKRCPSGSVMAVIRYFMLVVAKAVCVGKNQAISQITVDSLIEFCGKENVKDISPKVKGKVMNDQMFKLLTRGFELINYKGTEDERAAYQCTTFL